MQNDSRDLEGTKQYIRTHFGNDVVFSPASDCVNLRHEAKLEGKTIARIYDSFSRTGKPIHLIRFTYAD